MKVKIIKCDFDEYWYYLYIGETIDVREITEDFVDSDLASFKDWCYKALNPPNLLVALVKKCDCVVIN